MARPNSLKVSKRPGVAGLSPPYRAPLYAGDTLPTTPAFTLLNASLGWKPAGLSNRLSLTLTANNILDVTARRHASLLKDYAPLAGRDIRLTVAIRL